MISMSTRVGQVYGLEFYNEELKPGVLQRDSTVKGGLYLGVRQEEEMMPRLKELMGIIKGKKND
jgi:hypothetical protein